jgi:hypothetical protein
MHSTQAVITDHTIAERRVAQRLHVPIETARLIAERAGLPSSHDYWRSNPVIAVDPKVTKAEGLRHV